MKDKDDTYYLSDEFFAEIMNEAELLENARLEKRDRDIARIYKAIESFRGKDFLNKIKEDVEYCELNGDISLVKKPHGTLQGDGWGNVKGVYVEQHSVGDTGDCFWGYVYFPLKENLYLKWNFSD